MCWCGCLSLAVLARVSQLGGGRSGVPVRAPGLGCAPVVGGCGQHGLVEADEPPAEPRLPRSFERLEGEDLEFPGRGHGAVRGRDAAEHAPGSRPAAPPGRFPNRRGGGIHTVKKLLVLALVGVGVFAVWKKIQSDRAELDLWSEATTGDEN